MTIDQAFSELINNRELFMSLRGANSENYRKIKERFKKGELSIDLRMTLLNEAGYTYKLTYFPRK